MLWKRDTTLSLSENCTMMEVLVWLAQVLLPRKINYSQNAFMVVHVIWGVHCSEFCTVTWHWDLITFFCYSWIVLFLPLQIVILYWFIKWKYPFRSHCNILLISTQSIWYLPWIDVKTPVKHVKGTIILL